MPTGAAPPRAMTWRAARAAIASRRPRRWPPTIVVTHPIAAGERPEPCSSPHARRLTHGRTSPDAGRGPERHTVNGVAPLRPAQGTPPDGGTPRRRTWRLGILATVSAAALALTACTPGGPPAAELDNGDKGEMTIAVFAGLARGHRRLAAVECRARGRGVRRHADRRRRGPRVLGRRVGGLRPGDGLVAAQHPRRLRRPVRRRPHRPRRLVHRGPQHDRRERGRPDHVARRTRRPTPTCSATRSSASSPAPA